MKCPYCDFYFTRVIGSRETKDGKPRRRRVCPSCERRFTTLENFDLMSAANIKQFGNMSMPGGGNVFYCEMVIAFIDTVEGNRLYCECLRNKNMEPYLSAKDAWEIAKIQSEHERHPS